jgi:hypothetical protein
MMPAESTRDLGGLEGAEGSSLILAFAAGMVVSLLSLAVADPYRMAAVGLLAGVVGTLVCRRNPLSWVVFVSVLAANPANATTPVALNLYAGAVFLLLAGRYGWARIPVLVKWALLFGLLSVAISLLLSLRSTPVVLSIYAEDTALPRVDMITWVNGLHMEGLFTQVTSLVNYLLGPFLLIPLIFSRIRQGRDPEWLVKGLVFGLILPTLVLILLARNVGRPTLAPDEAGQVLVNVSTFKLGNLDIRLIRTQVGIVLAALICASFALAISKIRVGLRVLATVCLAAAGYLLLVTGSVGSALASLAGMFMILFLGKRQFSVRRYFILLIAAVGLAAGTWTVLPQGVQQYVVSRYELRLGGGGSATADRAWRWRKSLQYLGDHPTGVGWSLYLQAIGTYPHNDYISYAIAYGVMGGLLYLLYPLGLLASFALFKGNPRDPAGFALALVGAGVTTVLLLNSLSDHLTANRWYFNVVWSVIWYAFFASREPADASLARSAGGLEGTGTAPH